MHSLASCMIYGFYRLASGARLGRRADGSHDLTAHRGRSLAMLDTGYVSSPYTEGYSLSNEYI
jgi:hypothetical protein